MTDKEIFISIVDNDTLEKSDAIILLEGDGYHRYKKAVELFKTGWADKIIFSGGTDDYKYGSIPFEKIEPLILNEGVPQKDLLSELNSTNTKEQAEEIVKMCIENNWKRIILVASFYHQYRAYLTFLKVVLRDNLQIVIINSPVRNLSWFNKNVWGTRYDCLAQEFHRIQKYSEKGDLASYSEAIEYQKWKEEKEKI